MKCSVHVFLLNEHFSEEHAKEHYGGQDSENNRRYDWEDELNITSDVLAVNYHENVTYPLMGELPNGTSFRHEVSHMHLFEVLSSDAPITYIGASASIVDHCFSKKETEGYVITIYLKDYEPLANPIPGIYIASKEFPKELIF